MLDQVAFDSLLFIDIETVSYFKNYSDLNPRMQRLWAKKAKGILRRDNPDPNEQDIAACYTDRAGIFAEFGRIVCISVGYLRINGGERQLRLRSFSSRDDEKLLLEEFCALLDQHFPDIKRFAFCGHNIKEFDIPYICRRMLIHQIALPNALQLYGKKPWELVHLLDTMTLWKFGDIKHFTSLDLLAAICDIPTPKDDIDGSEVGRVFWEEDDLERICVYCEKDVLTVAQLMHYLAARPQLKEDEILFVNR